jgi:predicted dehydrogenase/aryl-alcohol dehydrogenase-like predicted oxidoreductase
MTTKLSWGIIGAGRIAGTFAKALAESDTGRVVAVGSRAQTSADRFGDEFDVPRRHGSYEALLADESVEAVYIATPHPMHAEWAIKAAEAGKHILCEKPLTLNYAEAMAVVEAARANDVFLMEAFMYRCHPQIPRLTQLIRQNVIGDVQLIQVTFSFRSEFNPESRLFKQELGGGGILDVGCYCTSMARLVAGAALGKDFAEPVEVKGTAHIGHLSRVDEYAIASLEFPGGILAQLTTGARLQMEEVVRIHGSQGSIVLPEPWFPSTRGRTSSIVIHRDGEEKPEEIPVESKLNPYTLEADIVAAHIADRQAPSPAMTWDDTLSNMKTLDRWRASIGFIYDSEKPEAQVSTVSKRPLEARAGNNMKYGRIAGVDKPVARVAIGAADLTTMPQVAVMFDDYFERGGNCFDTAHMYRGGLCDKLLGHWIKNRNVRDQVVVIAKAAHIQTDCVDIFLAHRDNTEVPVGEWVDAFNALLRAGQVSAFGGSNWSLDRVEAANEYAESKGLVGFAAVSNNFSLARMLVPVWDGCLASSDPESRAWLRKTQMPLLAWSSQARGFFTERGDPQDRSDEELVRSWYSDDNFQRRARATELADKRGVPPIAIALAYVLHQPFPIYALIGPHTLAETRTSFQALDVELTPQEVRWLNLEE